MKKILAITALLLALTGKVCAQTGITVVPVAGGASSTGAGNPTGTCLAPAFYVDTNTANVWNCKAGTWVIANLGTQTAVPFSATPSVTITSADTLLDFAALTGNVTSFTITGGSAGFLLTTRIPQDGVGGRTFAFPGNMLDPPTLQNGANQRTVTSWELLSNGNWQNLDVGPTGALPNTPTAPNGVAQSLVCNPSSGTCSAAWGLPGVTVRQVTGTTDTAVSGDCNGGVVDFTGSASVTSESVPTATSLQVAQCQIIFKNDTTGASTTVTVVPQTWSLHITNAMASGTAPTQVVLQKCQQARFQVDPLGLLWDVDITSYVCGGLAQTYNVTADQAITAGASLTAIPGLSWTMPAGTALSLPFSCKILYSQATAAASDSFGVQDVTTAPTNIAAQEVAYTSATALSAANITGLNTTTATAFTAFTPSAAATVFNAYIDGFIQQPSNATASVFQIMAQFTTNNGTIKQGSFCTVGAPK